MPDPVTHLSVGYVIARRCFREHKILFLCACMAPDIDGLVGLLYIIFFLPEHASNEEIRRVFELFHPSLPASLFFLPIFAGLLVVIFRRISKKLTPASMGKAYLLVLSAMVLHLGLDMLMTGNRPFWPLPYEAGLEIIPYTIWGVVVPMAAGLLLLTIDVSVSRLRKS